jgi:hypothetical protein
LYDVSTRFRFSIDARAHRVLALLQVSRQLAIAGDVRHPAWVKLCCAVPLHLVSKPDLDKRRCLCSLPSWYGSCIAPSGCGPSFLQRASYCVVAFGEGDAVLSQDGISTSASPYTLAHITWPAHARSMHPIGTAKPAGAAILHMPDVLLITTTCVRRPNPLGSIPTGHLMRLTISETASTWHGWCASKCATLTRRQ